MKIRAAIARHSKQFFDKMEGIIEGGRHDNRLKIRTTRRLVVLIVLLLAGRVICQTPQETLDNSGVIQLVKAGLPDDIVMAKIKGASATHFDTSVNGLASLKKAGVSSPIISLILSSTSVSALDKPANLGNGKPSRDQTISIVKNYVTTHPAFRSYGGIQIYSISTITSGNVDLVQLTQDQDLTNQEGKSVFSQNTDCEEKSKLDAIKEMGKSKGSITCHYYRDLKFPTSHTQLNDRSPVFVIRITGDIRNLGLVPCVIADNMRRAVIHTSKSKTLVEQLKPSFSVGKPKDEDKSSLNDIDPSAQEGWTTTQIGDGVYVLFLSSPLQPGEYAFEFETSRTIGGDNFYGFGVK